MAAIQGVYRIVKEKEALLEEQLRITQVLQDQMSKQREENAELKDRIELLERLATSSKSRREPQREIPRFGNEV